MAAATQSRVFKVVHALIGLAALVLLVAALLSHWVEPLAEAPRWPIRPAWTEGPVRFVCLLAAIGLAGWAFRRARKHILDEKSTQYVPSQPSVTWLYSLRNSAASTLDPKDREAVAAFVELVSNPVRYRSRVAETIDLDGRSINQLVSVEFHVTPPGSEFLYVPVLQPLKGELIDNFHLRDAAGTSLVDLSHEDTTKLASAGLRLLISGAVKRGEADAEGQLGVIETTSDDLVATELAMLQIMAQRGAADRAVAQTIERTIDMLGPLNSDEHRERLSKYLTALSAAYPIVAIVPKTCIVNNRVLLKYARAIVPSSHTHGRRGSLRLGLGLRPDQIGIPVSLALTCESYHLRVNGPTNAYVLSQDLRCRHCLEPVTPAWQSTTRRVDGHPNCFHEEKTADSDAYHFRVRRRRGQSFVHVYMRGYGRNKARIRDLEVFISFKELPPGTRGRAVATAMMTTAVIWIIAYLIAKNRLDREADLAALILALPAAAASWLGFTSDNNSLVGPSMLSRISLIFSGFLSVASVIVYLEYNTDRSLGSFSLLGLTDWVWITIFLASAVNLIYITYRFTLKLAHYGTLLRKADRQDREYTLN